MTASAVHCNLPNADRLDGAQLQRKRKIYCLCPLPANLAKVAFGLLVAAMQRA